MVEMGRRKGLNETNNTLIKNRGGGQNGVGAGLNGMKERVEGNGNRGLEWRWEGWVG